MWFSYMFRTFQEFAKGSWRTNCPPTFFLLTAPPHQSLPALPSVNALCTFCSTVASSLIVALSMSFPLLWPVPSLD